MPPDLVCAPRVSFLPLKSQFLSTIFVAQILFLDFFSRWRAAAKIFVLGQLSTSLPQLSWSQCSLRLLGFPLRQFLSSLKFFLFDFHPSTTKSRGLALCPASILVLKDLIFSWQDFLVQIAVSAQVIHGLVSLHLDSIIILVCVAQSFHAALGARLSVGLLPPVLLPFLVRA
jgi:hypothetical protein